MHGLVYIRRNRIVWILICIGVVSGVFGSSFNTLLPVFAANILEGGLESYGLLLFGMGTGGLTGTVSLALFGNLKNSTKLQVVTGVAFGLGLAIFSRITWLPASVVIIGLVGGASATFGVINNTILQSIVEDDYRGRVMSIHQLGWGSSAIGGLLMGALAEGVSASFALGVSGLATAVAIGILTLWVVNSIRSEPHLVIGKMS